MARAGLTPEKVISAAVRIADEQPGPLTLKHVAARLGVREPSLYQHVAGLEGLTRGVALHAKRELAQVLTAAAVGRAGDEAVAAMAHALRSWAHAHPGQYRAAERAPAAGDAEDEQASGQAVAVVAQVLAGYGLAGDQLVDAVRYLRAALHGFIRLEAAGGFGLPRPAGASFEQLVAAATHALRHWPAAAP